VVGGGLRCCVCRSRGNSDGPGRDPGGRGHIAGGECAGTSRPGAAETRHSDDWIPEAACELVPRITRAQAMDALSSMATVAGYKAVILAADTLPRLFPMLMTAAGTIAPARVFVIGAGVAGLQAIATARRLGAVVEAYDVRAAAGEQVRSLGAKFLDVDLGGLSHRRQGRLRQRAERGGAGPRARPDRQDRQDRRRHHHHRAGSRPPLRCCSGAMRWRTCAPARCWSIWLPPAAETAS
jgi:hypothetical protein